MAELRAPEIDARRDYTGILRKELVEHNPKSAKLWWLSESRFEKTLQQMKAANMPLVILNRTVLDQLLGSSRGLDNSHMIDTKSSPALMHLPKLLEEKRILDSRANELQQQLNMLQTVRDNLNSEILHYQVEAIRNPPRVLSEREVLENYNTAELYNLESDEPIRQVYDQNHGDIPPFPRFMRGQTIRPSGQAFENVEYDPENEIVEGTG